MKVSGIIAVVVRGVVSVMLAQAVVAHAGEIKVLSTSGMRSVVEELAPQFERTTGHKLNLLFGTTSALIKQIEAGDVRRRDLWGVVHRRFDHAGQAPCRHPHRRGAQLGRIAVREGAPKPDISTVEALKRALLDTPTIVYNKEATSYIYFASLLERLGIAEAMQPKTKFGTGFVAELVAKGEADMAVQLISDHMAVPGVTLVGPLRQRRCKTISCSPWASALTSKIPVPPRS